MRIAIDAHAIGGRLTGNETYIQNLAAQLLAQDARNEYFLFFSDEEMKDFWEKRAPNLQTLLVSRNPIWRLSVDFTRELRRLRPQVFHYQYTGPLLRISPEVVTIHDVSFEQHPVFFGQGERLRLQLTVRRAAKTAQKIITVSEFSKAEIVRLLQVPERKLAVIHNGVSSSFRPIEDQNPIRRRLERYGIGRPYLLVVGNLCRRKNQRMMVRAFARWLSRNPTYPHRLVLVGNRGAYGQKLQKEVVRLGLDRGRVLLPGYVAHEDLPYLYAGAELLLNTSLYEGFGLPLVEAMACGLPVVASRASCFPEIAGNAARYVDPEDPDDIAAAIREVLENTALREELIQHGLCRARQFRWDTAAHETLKVYYEVANGAMG